jgi:hypothetical protein
LEPSLHQAKKRRRDKALDALAEAHLIDASSSGEAAALVAYAMEETVATGRPRNTLVEEEAIRMIKEAATAVYVRDYPRLGWAASSHPQEPNQTAPEITETEGAQAFLQKRT